MKGETSIEFRWLNDFMSRHLLAENLQIKGFKLNDFMFTEGGVISLSINTYKTFISFLNCIEDTKFIDGIIDFAMYENLEDIPKDGGIVYQTDDQERPYFYSKIIKMIN
jgi:hypothetical protein